jgi:hypothetical protein
MSPAKVTGAWKGGLVGSAILGVALWLEESSGGLLALGVFILGATFGYTLGHQRGEEDVWKLLNPPPLTEDERNTLLMKAMLPRWRRVAGWAFPLGAPHSGRSCTSPSSTEGAPAGPSFSLLWPPSRRSA